MSKHYRRNLIGYWQLLYHVHHIKPLSTFENKDDLRIHHPSDLIALHPDDHISIHKRRGDKWINGDTLLTVAGRKMSTKSKPKISEALTGRQLSKGHKAKYRISNLGRKWYINGKETRMFKSREDRQGYY